MITQDDRTDEQRQTHRIGIVARDSFMSGWGGARDGFSRCAWACEGYRDAEKLLAWVKARPEMKYVRQVYLQHYRAPRGTAHFHIYVAGPEHPALQEGGAQ